MHCDLPLHQMHGVGEDHEDEQRPDERQSDALECYLRFHRRRTPHQSFVQRHRDVAAVENRQGQNIHDGQGDADEGGELQQHVDSALRVGGRHLRDADRTRQCRTGVLQVEQCPAEPLHDGRGHVTK